MSKRALIWVIVLGALVAVAAATNPAPEAHRERIREVLAERSLLAKVLGISAMTAFASAYHPLIVASYTTVNGRVISVGAFGMVLVLEPKT